MLPSRAGGIFEAAITASFRSLASMQIEAGKLLLRLGERAVGDSDLPVADPYRRGGFDRLQRFGGNENAALPEAITAGLTFPVVDGVQLLFFEVDQT